MTLHLALPWVGCWSSELARNVRPLAIELTNVATLMHVGRTLRPAIRLSTTDAHDPLPSFANGSLRIARCDSLGFAAARQPVDMLLKLVEKQAHLRRHEPLAGQQRKDAQCRAGVVSQDAAQLLRAHGLLAEK